MQRVFEALSSPARRQILIHLAQGSLTAGEIARRFEVSRSAVSQHLGILQNAGLVASEKKGKRVHYRLLAVNLANTLNSYMKQVCAEPAPTNITD